MNDILVECQRAIGHAPRNFGIWNALTYLWVRKPDWLYENPQDPFGTFFEKRWDVFQNGVLVWGVIVQANRAIFKSGQGNYLADVLFSLVDSPITSPDNLRQVANRIFKVKGTTPQESRLKPIAQFLTDERTRGFGIEVPSQLSPDWPCMISTTFLARKHLPQQRLCSNYFPLLVNPQPPYVAIPLPSKYWPAELVARWVARD